MRLRIFFGSLSAYPMNGILPSTAALLAHTKNQLPKPPNQQQYQTTDSRMSCIKTGTRMLKHAR